MFADSIEFEQLVSMLLSEDEATRINAIEQLSNVSNLRAFKLLVQAFYDSSPKVRYLATIAISRQAYSKAITNLVALLGNENNQVRDCAASTLAKFGEPAILPMIEALSSENVQVRREAARAMAMFGTPLSNEIKRRGLLDQRLVEPLIKALSDVDRKVRYWAVKSLNCAFDKRALEPLMALLDEKDEPIWMTAVEGLGRLRDEWAVEPLLGMLKQGYYKRKQIISTLGKIGGKRVAGQLAEIILDKEEDLDIRRSALFALGKTNEEKYTKLLIGLLNDKNYPLRDAVAIALAEMNAQEAIEALVNALKDTNVNFRRNAAYALSKMKNTRAIRPLIEALYDEDVGVRYWAILALEKFGDERALARLEWLNQNDKIPIRDYSDLGTIETITTSAINKIKERYPSK